MDLQKPFVKRLLYHSPPAERPLFITLGETGDTADARAPSRKQYRLDWLNTEPTHTFHAKICATPQRHVKQAGKYGITGTRIQELTLFRKRGLDRDGPEVRVPLPPRAVPASKADAAWEGFTCPEPDCHDLPKFSHRGAAMWHTRLQHPEVDMDKRFPSSEVLDKGIWSCLSPICSTRKPFSSRRLVMDHLKEVHPYVDPEKWYPKRYTTGSRQRGTITHSAEVAFEPEEDTKPVEGIRDVPGVDTYESFPMRSTAKVQCPIFSKMVYSVFAMEETARAGTVSMSIAALLDAFGVATVRAWVDGLFTANETLAKVVDEGLWTDKKALIAVGNRDEHLRCRLFLILTTDRRDSSFLKIYNGQTTDYPNRSRRHRTEAKKTFKTAQLL